MWISEAQVQSLSDHINKEIEELWKDTVIRKPQITSLLKSFKIPKV